MRLCNQKIGAQLANQFVVNVVKGFPRFEAAPNLRIDFSAGNGNIKGWRTARWKSPHPLRVIALMRAPYQHFAGAQRADDFGATRQKRNDAHVMQPAALSGPSG